VEILVKDGPSLHDSSSTNLEQEVCMKKNIIPTRTLKLLFKNAANIVLSARTRGKQIILEN